MASNPIFPPPAFYVLMYFKLLVINFSEVSAFTVLMQIEQTVVHIITMEVILVTNRKT